MSSSISKVRVVKTSGDLDFFDPNLIASDCMDAGIDFWTAAEVAFEVSKKIYDGISSDEIQKTTLEMLSKKNQEAAERYKRFHSMYVRTSRNTIDSFDRKKIEESLLNETTLPKEIAENISKDAEIELRRLKLDFISAPLIREVVNVKLLENGFEEARRDYTRVGMPVYDAMKVITSGSGSQNIKEEIAGRVLKEYTLLKILPLHIADSQMNGDIHIHSIENFAISTGDIYISPEVGTARNAYLAASTIFSTIRNFRKLSSGSITIPLFTSPFSSYIENMTLEEVRSFLKYFLAEAGEFGIKLGINSGDTTFRIIQDIYKNAETKLPELSVSVNSGAEEFLYTSHLNKIDFWNEVSPFFSQSSLIPGYILPVSEKKILSSALKVTINLPRIAYLSEGDEKKFFEKLHTLLPIIKEVLLRKKKVIKKAIVPKLNAEFFYEVGFLGLNEMSLAFTGKKMYKSSSALEFALRVLTALKSTVEDWRLTEGENFMLVPTDDFDVATRFAKLDYGLYPSKAKVNGRKSTGKIFYSTGMDTGETRLNKSLKINSELLSRVHGVSAEVIEVESPSTLRKTFNKLIESDAPSWRFKIEGN